MRTDCTVNTRPVKCPNATRLGYGLGVANVGDLIVYKEYYNDDSFKLRVARMIGRVTAPKIASDDSEVKGWILAMVLSDNHCHIYERWVNPGYVIEVRKLPTNILRFFAQPVWPDHLTMRKAGEYGSLSDHYIAESGVWRAAGLESKS